MAVFSLVRKIAHQLQQHGLKIWLEDEQVPPGQPILDFIEQAIQNTKSIAVFIGSENLGKWQKMELLSLMDVPENIPIIPILLPGVKAIPSDFPFLKNRQSISFTHSDDQLAIDNLVWVITRQKPNLLKLPSVHQTEKNLDG